MICDLKLEIRLPQSDAFVLGFSELGTGVLYEGELDGGYRWVNFLSDTSDIIVERGISLDQNIFGKAEATTLQVIVHSSKVDPSTVGINPNVPIRLLLGSDVLFSGTVRSFKVEYDKFDLSPKVSIEALDLIKELSNTFTTAQTQETFANRLTSTYSNTTVIGGDAVLAPKKTPVSVWDMLNIAVNSEGGLVFPTRTGAMKAYGKNATYPSPSIYFSDIHGAFSSDFSVDYQVSVSNLHACYKDVNVQYDTTQVVNTLNITNISSDIGGVDTEETIATYTDTDSVLLYGEISQSALTNLTTLPDIDSLKTYVFNMFADPQVTLNNLKFTPKETFQALVDVGDVVNVHFSGPNVAIHEDFLVTGVGHDITPELWDIELSLFPTSKLVGG